MELSFELRPGDTVVLYTDGVTECPAAPPATGMFGSDRLAATLAALPSHAPLQAWSDSICHTIQEFSKAGSATDDLTLLLLRRP